MSKVTRDELLEALTGFRLSVRTPRGYQEGGEIANPETVADVLYATLSRIAAERAPDLGEADDLTCALDEAKKVAHTLEFACILPGKTPDFTFCGGPAAEAYWSYFTPARISSLVAAIEAALKAHEPIQIYESADGCDHPCPVAANGRGEYHHGKPEYSEWDEWNDNHPYGEGLDDSSSDRICLLTPRSMACPACSKLVYDTWGDDDRYIDASDCLVRPATTAELTKGEGNHA